MNAKILLLGILSLGLIGAAHAAPASRGAEVTPASRLAVIEMPAVVPPAKSDARAKPQPLRFAMPISVSINPDTHGQWDALPGGRSIWRARVSSQDANSLNFGFTQFHLPAGGELYLYDVASRDVYGPYTEVHNASGQLWTPLLRGHDAVIEVNLPANAKDDLHLALTQVNHGFLEFWKKDVRDKSGSCNVDVVCPQGDAWRDEIRSVARYTIGGQFLCSGQLVNNTRVDFTPYFLTANHCLSSEAEANSTVFYWNYQTSQCGGTPDGQLGQTQSGASLTATYAPTDFTLLRLQQRPDANFRVFYSGWDHSEPAPSGATCLHHPAGDEKRISMTGQQTFPASYGGAGSSGDGTHLFVPRWDSGTTEGGSSGSGLWNNNRRLVGQLHGGNAACDAPDGSDWFGRLAVSWSGGGNAADSLKPTLDPLNSLSNVLDGADPEKAKSALLQNGVTTGRFGGAFALLTLLGLGCLSGLRRYSSSSRYLRNSPRNW